MWKCLTLSLVATTTIFAAMSGASAQSFYFGVQGGLNFAHDGETDNSGFDLAFDTGYAFGALVGYDMGNQIRLEGEVTYRANDMDNLAGIPVVGEMSSTAFMANLYYDFATGGSWAPYVGGGLGAASVNFDSAVDVSETVLAYQFIGGVGYDITPSMVLAFDYRYFGVDTPSFGGAVPFEQEYSNSTFMFGVRSSF